MNETQSHALKCLLVCACVCSCSVQPFDPAQHSIFGEVKGGVVASTEAYEEPTDALIFRHAEMREHEYRQLMENSRITRELSDGLASGFAAVTVASSAWRLSREAIALAGLGATAVNQGQGVFKASSRRDAFLEGAREICLARTEFLSFNGVASGSELTQNGVSLYRRVKAIEKLTQSALSGGFASLEDVQNSAQDLSTKGAVSPGR